MPCVTQHCLVEKDWDCSTLTTDNMFKLALYILVKCQVSPKISNQILLGVYTNSLVSEFLTFYLESEQRTYTVYCLLRVDENKSKLWYLRWDTS